VSLAHPPFSNIAAKNKKVNSKSDKFCGHLEKCLTTSSWRQFYEMFTRIDGIAGRTPGLQAIIVFALNCPEN
jgi:hypothetical protein